MHMEIWLISFSKPREILWSLFLDSSMILSYIKRSTTARRNTSE